MGEREKRQDVGRHQREEDFPKKEMLGREPRQDSGLWKATAGLGKAGSYKGRNGLGGVRSGVEWKEREPGELFSNWSIVTMLCLVSHKQQTDSVIHTYIGFPGGEVVKNPPVNEGYARDMGSIPGLERSPGV